MTCNAEQVYIIVSCHSERSRGISQRNDEARMSNVELMQNDEPIIEEFGVSHSFVIRHSNFVIRLMSSRGGEG